MKNVTSFFLFSLFVALYCLLWAITSPIALVRLFLHVVADDDDNKSITPSRVMRVI